MKHAAVSLAAVAATLALGCMPSHPAAVSTPEGYVTAGYSALWPGKTVAVCWNELDDDDADARALTQAAVTNQYGQDALGFSFTGWGACTSDSKGVRISVKDEVPRVTAYGAWLDGQPEGVILNFAFVAAGAAPCRAASDKSECVRAYGLHEFGHVLGLRHEANRPDGQCPAEDQTGGLGEAGAVPVDAYDPNSVMNYCHLDSDFAAGATTVLSAGDVNTLSEYYGRDVSFPTADLGAQCAAGAGAWDSVDNCCTLGATWTPASAAGYRSCALPAAALQAQACGFAHGQWQEGNSCCSGDAPQPGLPRWNTFYRRCL